MKKISRGLITVFLFQLAIFPGVAFAQSLVAEDFAKSTPKNTILKFSAADFSSRTNPPSGQTLVSVRFDQVTNSAAGNLKIGGSIIAKGFKASVQDLNSLVFEPSPNYEGEAIFTWTAIYSRGQSPYPGAVVITVGAGDKAPSELAEEKPPVKPESEKPKQDASENKGQSNDKTSVPEKKPSDSGKTKEPAKTENNIKETPQNTGLKPLRYEDMLTHWGAYSAGMLASRGYVIGEDYGNNFYFRPDDKIDRLSFVLMVNSIFGVKPADSMANNPFSDKNVPSYVMRVGISAYEYDVIAGTEGKDGKLYFYPYQNITRAEAITILDYALSLDTYGVDAAEFRDVKQIPDWAMQSVKNLEAYGIIQGFEDNTIRPKECITRAQAAEMVWQALKFLDVKRNANATFKTVIYGD